MGGSNSTPVVGCDPEEERSFREGGGKTTLDIAITGVKGAGKSSLVNALRGLKDFDKDAAKTDVIEGTKEPMGYPHPAFPDVTIWDLPGIGTPVFRAKEYLEKVNYRQYDFFIIVASHRFTVYDILLSHEVQKMKKQFYYVRSKMDVSIRRERLNPNFNEEATIQNVRRDCLKNFVQAGISSPQIFLISSWYRDKYDFLLLQRTLRNEVETLRRRVFRPADPPKSENKRDDKPTESLRKAMGGSNSTPVVGCDPEEERSFREEGGKATLDIAITGLKGAGKSSLVNALRGLSDFDEDAAKTDVIEGTKEPMGYPHPAFPDVTIWDLPGIGTPVFRAKEYLEKVNYRQYDFFIIVASHRFTVYDILLSHEIQKMKKQFYYVCSKMDVRIRRKRLNPNFNEEATIQNVRRDCLRKFVQAGISSPQIFLISSWYQDKYDFLLLQRTLRNEVEALRRCVFRPAEPPTESLRKAMGGSNSTPVVGCEPEEERSFREEGGKATLDIAISGVKGAGKPSLVNALRGLKDFHEDAAKTDMNDFLPLQRTLRNEVEALRRRVFRPAEPPNSENKRDVKPTESLRKAMGGSNSTPVVGCDPEEERSFREEGGKATLDIAITGVKGAGKSSLVNALRGLKDFDEDAAKTDVIEGTKEPMGYPHPAFPDVTIWDLPGIGTPVFRAKEYLEKVNYRQYDFFIIVASHRFTVYDILLSHEIQKMKKQFYYVRSKMDVRIRRKRLYPNFNEEATIQNVRRDCLRKFVQAGISSPQIFLISSWYQDKYDFLLLQRTLRNEVEALRRRVFRPVEPPNSENKRDDKPTESLRKAMGGSKSTPVVSCEPEEERSFREGGGKTTLDIAITGVKGAGKSSLVNALRGLSDFDEDAAEIDVIEGTKEPMSYPHPAFPDVTIWDLPGIGTPDFRAKEYLEKVNYSQYDFFIIVASHRFTVHDIQLSHEVQKMKKQFYYVRSKMDVSIHSEKLNPNFNEEATIQNVRRDCLRNLVQAGISSPQIFLISSWYQDMYDFLLLQRTLRNEVEALRRRVFRPVEPPNSENKRDDKSTYTSKGSGIRFILLQKMLKIDLAKLKDILMQRNLEEVTEEIRQELDALENVKLDIAITGVSGAGKSSLVNAMRGMTDYEDGSAKVGITQTTMECQAYPHPLFLNVTIWDLPGIGTPEFTAKDYLKKVNFSQYDFFIIVAFERFTENDVLLAHEIKKMKQKFYFVRSQMDVSMIAEMRDPKFSMETSLQKIRKDCCDKLTKLGESNPRVFLISRRDLNMYDFPSLQEALENDLDDLKRHALIQAMPIFSREILEKKKAAMEKLIMKFAIVSCAAGAIPVPGLSLVCDTGILVAALCLFCKVFGLEEESLRRVAKVMGKDYQVLKSAIKKSPMANEITPKLVVGLLSRSLLVASVTIIEIVLDFVPILGSLFGGIGSFITTYYVLSGFLKDIVEDAENVRAKAAEP